MKITVTTQNGTTVNGKVIYLGSHTISFAANYRQTKQTNSPKKGQTSANSFLMRGISKYLAESSKSTNLRISDKSGYTAKNRTSSVCAYTKECELCFICDFKAHLRHFLFSLVVLYIEDNKSVLKGLILQLKNIFAYCIYATKDSII